MPRYKDVDVNHPSIVSSIKRMAEQGKPIEEITRVIGMPAEVVRKHTEAGEAEKPKKKGVLDKITEAD